MKKRIYIALAAALFAAALIVILLLRGGNSQTVGICYWENEDSSNAAYRSALEQALTQQGYKLVVTDADTDQAKQLSIITELTDKKCDILIIEPVMTDAPDELKNAVINAKIPVVLCNRELDMTLWEDLPNVFYVGADSRQGAALMGEMVLQLPGSGDINGDGVISYLMICGPENNSRSQLQLQTTGNALAAGEKEAQALATVYGDWTDTSGRKLCKQELAKFGKDIEVILCGNRQMALGAMQAIEDGGRTVGKDVYLLCMDGDSETLELITQGSVTGTAVRDTDGEIEGIVKTLELALEDEAVEKQTTVPYLPIFTDKPPLS